MKTNKILLVLIFLLSIHSFAQSQMEEKKEQIRALKVGFITTELALTTDEAAKFWPIYNAYDDKQFEIRHQKMKAFKQRMDAIILRLSASVEKTQRIFFCSEITERVEVLADKIMIEPLFFEMEDEE